MENITKGEKMTDIMRLLDILFKKDEGKKIPEIMEIEQEMARYGHYIITGRDGRYGELNSELRKQRFQEYVRKLKALKYQNDAERIRHGLQPKYGTYTKEQEKELLKNFPPYQLKAKKDKINEMQELGEILNGKKVR